MRWGMDRARAQEGTFITTSTPLRPRGSQRRSTSVTDRFPRPSDHVARRAPDAHGASTVSPVQFIEPEHSRATPEQYHPIADHSDVGMRRLRTPFDLDPV